MLALQFQLWACMQVGWADRKLKAFVTNVCTTEILPPIQRLRFKYIAEVTHHVIKYVAVIHMVDLLFSEFFAINVHDRLRQGILARHTLHKSVGKQKLGGIVFFLLYSFWDAYH